MTDFYKYNNKAGIYKWQNKINGKCYIGQSINLGLRLRHHTYRYNHFRYNCPLYKAFKKYGIENFTLEILYSVSNPEPFIKTWLDRLEVSYIEQYNAYGNTGYNQTRGGDRCVIGFKMAENQKNAISLKMKQFVKSGKWKAPVDRKPVYIYDTILNENFCFKSRTEASQILNINKSSVIQQCNNKTKMVKHRYICANTKEDLEQKLVDLE